MRAYTSALSSLALASFLVAGPVSADGNGGISPDIIINSGTNATASATGGVRETFVHGSNEGSAHFNQGGDHKGANVSGNFGVGFDAESSGDEGFGTAKSRGQATGGLALGLDSSDKSQRYAGRVEEQGGATTKGQHGSSNAWGHGNLQGGAWMNDSNASVSNEAGSGQSAEDQGRESYISGWNTIGGGVSIVYPGH